MRIRYIVFFLSCICIGCSNHQKPSFNKENAQGEWLVQAIHMDKNYYKPNALIMEFSGDSLYYKDMDEERQLAKRKLMYSKDSLGVDTVRYPINKFRIIDNNLHFVRNIAHRIVPTPPFDIGEVKNILVSKEWKTDKGVFIFEKEGDKLKFIPEKAKEYSTHCFEIQSYKNAVFLIKKGNQIACNRDYQFIEQIISISEKEMVTFRFVDGVFKNIVYQTTIVPEGIKKSTSFQLCNPYLNKNNPSDRYYYKGTTYHGGLYHIRKIFDQQYKVPQNSKESGIFQVRFVVNCEGKAGMFEYQAFDYDYNLKEFSSEVTDQIFEITKKLQDWIPGKKSRTNDVIDTYIYLSFRIKDGKIIRIYP